MFESIKENLKVWHVLVSFIVVVVCVVFVMLYIPKYVTYLETQNMRREILWSETHEKAALQIGPVLKKYPEYIEYLNSTKD